MAHLSAAFGDQNQEWDERIRQKLNGWSLPRAVGYLSNLPQVNKEYMAAVRYIALTFFCRK